ncbi:hypothetical protein GOODEAATRI_011299 [Goodea atripinnis]|uniref:Uncharacterized protein n=1 Tax=Goodea atripinnis TaxID=208336 RepID=A0ABV0MGY3_9TELE
MISSCLRLLHVLLVLCGRLALSATSSPNSSPTYGVPFSSPTPAPGVTGATEEATLYPSLVTKQQSVSETPAAVTEAPSPTTMVSAQAAILQVEFIVGYTARGELMYGIININLADVALEQLLLQKHSVQFQCPLSSPLALTAKAAFIETTVYPEPPRGFPQLHWRFPFGFFSRGAAELDGHVVPSGSSAERVSWSWMMFPLLLLAGLGFFTVQLDR